MRIGSLNLLDAATFEIAGGTGTLSGVTETGGPNNAQFIYDGEDNNSIQAFGLPNLDFTDGGSNDRFVIDLSSVTGSIDVLVRVIEGVGNFSDFTISGVTSAGILEFPFSGFSDFGTGADLAAAKLVGIFVYLDTGEGFGIDSFVATGPQVSSPDTTRPTVGILKRSRLKTPRSRHTIKGTASDGNGVARVEAKAKGSGYKRAKLGASGLWKFRTPRLKSGNNVFKIRAFDASGNSSKVERVRVWGR